MPSSRTRPPFPQQDEQILHANVAAGVEIPQTNAVEEQHPHRATVRAPVVIEECPHGQVDHTVAVEIAQRGRRGAEPIVIIESTPAEIEASRDPQLTVVCAKLGYRISYTRPLDLT